MKPRILITVEGGKIVGVIANGSVEVFFETADTLDGISQIQPVTEIPNEDFDSLLRGKQDEIL